MGWLGTWFGAPTLARLADDAAQALRALGAADVRIDLAQGAIDATVGGAPYRLNLGNLYADWRTAARRDRAGVVQRYLGGILDASAADASSLRYEDVRSRILPVLRSANGLAIAALGIRRGLAADAAAAELPSRPFAGELAVALVRDLPTSMAYVTRDDLARWQVGFEAALDDAIDNLRGLPEHGGWRPLGDGLWSGEWGDAYEPSRLLLPDLVHRLGVARPVALAPFNNALMVTSADNAAGLARMATTAREAREERGRWLSFQPLALEGREWRPVDLPAGATAQAFAELQLEKRVSDYAEQQQLLDARHEAEGTDIFVATCQGARKDGVALCWSVWGEGVDTLLPESDLLTFAWKQDGETTHVMVRWADALRIAGALMQRTADAPPRWRVQAFPDAAMLEQLKAHAAV
jgi:hypothetical protein